MTTLLPLAAASTTTADYLVSYPMAAVILAILLGCAACLKVDKSQGFAAALVILGVCLGFGGCCHLIAH